MSRSRNEIAARVSQIVTTTVVTAREVLVKRETNWRVHADNRLTVRHYGPTVRLELWDQAPVNATPSGYANPWWARDADGAWWVVATVRKGARRDREAIVAYRVDDEVRMRIAMTRASSEVGRETARGLLARAGIVAMPNGWGRASRDPRVEYLRLPIDC